MAKPSFDPNQPFEPVKQDAKPAFDPNATFQPVNASKGDVLASYINEIKNKIPSLDYSKERADQIGQASIESLPVMGATLGGGLGAMAAGVGAIPGAAAGGAIGAISKNIINNLKTRGKEFLIKSPSIEGTKEAFNIAGKGAAEGVAQEMTGQITGALASKGADALKHLGETKAFKAAGAMLKDMRSAFNKDPQKVNELGKTMLDNGLVQMGDKVENIAQKSETLRRQTGQEIGDVYNKVKSALNAENIPVEARVQIEAAGFHPEAQADELKKLISTKFKGIPGSTTAINKAHQVIDELAMNGNNLDPQHVLELKGSVDSMINWSKKSQDLPLEQDALKEIRSFIQNKLNNQVGLMDQALNSKASAELLRLNKLYGNVSTIANISRDRVAREMANRSFGLTDTIMTGGGAAAGATVGASMHHGIEGAILGSGLGIANKIGRTYGNAALATSANQAGNFLGNNASLLGTGNAALFGTAMERKLKGNK